MGEAKWKADYGEPWKTVPSQSSARLALIEERHGLQSRFLIADDMAERIVACVNALSGVTNVEALGALLASIKALDVMRPESTYQVKLPDGSIVDVPTPEEVLQFWAAYDALYALPASEAKPL